ncbi:LysE family translocator [Wenxinia marina]|uniref:Putative threonine efflux protein n=1 Tax=Wenxinia marina DSM 24838 TaxID=1123501 RepID=A0A0D0QFH0_9RHOB|nr:LysE family translocator [Wenxinia marina]KIQ69723.1 Putative threonine efflux protein [Wenxinia marina DSM 24838]GGL60714.1 lysine transporter LysE [Wenxinia marina]
MAQSLFLALLGFAFATTVTPGPNNMMVMASGANFGLRRTLPHVAGIALGFGAMILALGLGLMQAFHTVPGLETALTWACLAYLLWLAWKIATAAPKAPEAPEARPAGRPLTFLQAAAFQWVNPKAWAMGTSALTAYAGAAGPGAVATVAATFAAVSVPCILAWTLLGQQMRRILSRPSRLRAFNVTMALLMLASLLPVLAG